MHILDLPPELLTALLSYLPGRDLARVCRTCKCLRDLVTQGPLWHWRCRKEYKLQSNEGWDASYYEIYSKVAKLANRFWDLSHEEKEALEDEAQGYILSPSQELPSWGEHSLEEYWRVVSNLTNPATGKLKLELLCRLSVVVVSLQHSNADRERTFSILCKYKYWLGQILVEEYFPTKHIKEPLRSVPWFSITLENGEASVKCLRSFGLPHLDEVKFDQEEEKDGRHTLTTNLICHGSKSHQELEEDSEVFQRWMEQEQVRGMRPDLLRTNWDLTRQQKYHLKLSPLVLPSPKPDTVIQPGLFKGSYIEHGTYLLMLSYSDETQEIHLTKITGDNIVPAGEISVYVDLRRPMILNREQQESLQTLRDIDTPDLPPESDGYTNFSQPFIFPNQCEVGDDCRDLPKDCKARYHSKGRIAAPGYNNPAFVKNHWIMFSEDLFGVLWLDLHSFTSFSRVKEEFDVGNNLCHLQTS